MLASAGELIGIIAVAVVVGVAGGAWFMSRCIKIVQQGSVGVVKRFGEFRSVDQPGMRILMPFMDRMEKVDMREFPMTGDQQAVITKDNVSLQVSATIFCQVIDVKSALFEINDYQLAVDQLSRTALRAVFGELSLDQALSERETINVRMQDHMADATVKWGVRLNRIEILDITPPINVVTAMSEQKEAEQHKKAAILKSEGEQQSAINSAGGRKQAAVLEAEGAKQAAILRAEAEMKVLELQAEGEKKALQLARRGRSQPPHLARYGHHQPAHACRPAAQAPCRTSRPPTTPRWSCPTKPPASWERPRCCSVRSATRTSEAPPIQPAATSTQLHLISPGAPSATPSDRSLACSPRSQPPPSPAPWADQCRSRCTSPTACPVSPSSACPMPPCANHATECEPPSSRAGCPGPSDESQ